MKLKTAETSWQTVFFPSETVSETAFTSISPWARLRRFLLLRDLDREPGDFLPIPLLPLARPSVSLDRIHPLEQLHQASPGDPALSEFVLQLNEQEGSRWYLLTIPFQTGIPVWQSIFLPDEFADLALWASPDVSLLIFLEAIERQGWRPLLFLHHLPLSDLGSQSLLLQLARRRLWTGKLSPGTVVVVGTSELPRRSAGQPDIELSWLPSVLHGSIFPL